MSAEQAKLKDEISLLRNELLAMEVDYEKHDKKIPLSFLFTIALLILLNLYYQWIYNNDFNYWIAPLTAYIGYKFFNLHFWWEDKKVLKQKISEYKRHIQDLNIEHDTYGKVVEILFGEQ